MAPGIVKYDKLNKEMNNPKPLVKNKVFGIQTGISVMFLVGTKKEKK